MVSWLFSEQNNYQFALVMEIFLMARERKKDEGTILIELVKVYRDNLPRAIQTDSSK